MATAIPSSLQGQSLHFPLSLDSTERCVLGEYITSPSYHKLAADFHKSDIATSGKKDKHVPRIDFKRKIKGENWRGDKGLMHEHPKLLRSSLSDSISPTSVYEFDLSPKSAGQVLDSLRELSIIKNVSQKNKAAGEVMIGLIAQQYKYQRYCNRFLDSHPAEIDGFSSTAFDFSALSPEQMKDPNFEAYPFVSKHSSGKYSERRRQIEPYEIEYGLFVSNMESSEIPYESEQPLSEWQEIIENLEELEFDSNNTSDMEIKQLIVLHAAYVTKLQALCTAMESGLCVENFEEKQLRLTCTHFQTDKEERVYKSENEHNIREALLAKYPTRYKEWEVREHKAALTESIDGHGELSLLHKDGTLLKQIFAFDDYQAPNLTKDKEEFMFELFFKSLKSWQENKIESWNKACEQENTEELKVHPKTQIAPTLYA